jgi:hypothetical protein
MARLSNTEHIWRYYFESYDLPSDRLPTPDKSYQILKIGLISLDVR